MPNSIHIAEHMLIQCNGIDFCISQNLYVGDMHLVRSIMHRIKKLFIVLITYHEYWVVTDFLRFAATYMALFQEQDSVQEHYGSNFNNYFKICHCVFFQVWSNSEHVDILYILTLAIIGDSEYHMIIRKIMHCNLSKKNIGYVFLSINYGNHKISHHYYDNTCQKI